MLLILIFSTLYLTDRIRQDRTILYTCIRDRRQPPTDSRSSLAPRSDHRAVGGTGIQRSPPPPPASPLSPPRPAGEGRGTCCRMTGAGEGEAGVPAVEEMSGRGGAGCSPSPAEPGAPVGGGGGRVGGAASQADPTVVSGLGPDPGRGGREEAGGAAGLMAGPQTREGRGAAGCTPSPIIGTPAGGGGGRGGGAASQAGPDSSVWSWTRPGAGRWGGGQRGGRAGGGAADQIGAGRGGPHSIPSCRGASWWRRGTGRWSCEPGSTRH